MRTRRTLDLGLLAVLRSSSSRSCRRADHAPEVVRSRWSPASFASRIGLWRRQTRAPELTLHSLEPNGIKPARGRHTAAQLTCTSERRITPPERAPRARAYPGPTAFPFPLPRVFDGHIDTVGDDPFMCAKPLVSLNHCPASLLWGESGENQAPLGSAQGESTAQTRSTAKEPEIPITPGQSKVSVNLRRSAPRGRRLQEDLFARAASRLTARFADTPTFVQPSPIHVQDPDQTRATVRQLS